jgi:transcriptional regulator with XRE-family HTH domain
MLKKGSRRSAESERGAISPQKRVKIVAERLYAGNQSAMARDLGCTHAAISQILHGRRGAGAGILRAIAALPGVSPEWAILGVGEPPAVLGRPGAEKLYLPLVTSLGFAVSDPPVQAQSSMAEQVLTIDYSPTRLIFQVQDGDPCLQSHGGRLKAGDHILFEADRRVWIRAPEFLDGRLCVIASARANNRTAVLVRVSVGGGKVLVTGGVEADSLDVRMKTIYGRSPRRVQIDPESCGPSVATEMHADSAELETTDIIAASIRFWGLP